MGGTTGLAAVLSVLLAAVPVTDDAVRVEVDRLMAEVSGARHLAFHGTLPARAVTREAAETEISATLRAGVDIHEVSTGDDLVSALVRIVESRKRRHR